jgi:hypothetical protein
LEKTHLHAILNEYAYPRSVGLEHQWSERIPLDLVLLLTTFSICDQIRTGIPTDMTPVTMELLSASPGKYVPCLKFMSKVLEWYHNQQSGDEKQSDSETLPKLFTVFPNPSMKWRFVSLNADILQAFLQL